MFVFLPQSCNLTSFTFFEQKTQHWPKTFTRRFERGYKHYEHFQISAGHQAPDTISSQPFSPQNAADPNPETSWLMWNLLLHWCCTCETLTLSLVLYSLNEDLRSQTTQYLNPPWASPPSTVLLGPFKAQSLRSTALWKWKQSTAVVQPVAFIAGNWFRRKKKGGSTWSCPLRLATVCLS